MKYLAFSFYLMSTLLFAELVLAQDTGQQEHSPKEEKSDQRLFTMMHNKDFEGVKRLIEAGANVNSVYDGSKYAGNKSWSVAAHLVAYGKLDLLKLAVQKGADVHLASKDDDGKMPIHYAAEYGRIEIVHYLQSLGADTSKLIKALIDAGANPNIAWGGKKDSTTPTTFAINYKKFHILKTLVNNGASLQHTSTGGVPFHRFTTDNYIGEAISSGNVEIFNYILSKSNYKHISDHTTALHLAVDWNMPYAINKLLALGLSTTAKDKRGKTPLDIAVEEDNKFAQRLLLYGSTENDKKLFQLMEEESLKEVGFYLGNIRKKLIQNELTGLKGGKLVLGEVLKEKKLTLVNFWATWCGPCIKEMPSMQQLQVQMGKDLQIVAISTDKELQKISDFDQQRGPFPFRYFHDPAWKIYNAFYSTLPGSYVMTHDGRILFSVKGSFDWNNPKMIELMQLLLHY